MPAFTKQDYRQLALACSEASTASAELEQKCFEASVKDVGCVSDGYHTFDELYEHRITLFIALCFEVHVHVGSTLGWQEGPWRSKLHSDGTALEGWFVMGIGTEPGDQLTYHLPLERWDETDFVVELERAPEWDKHTSADVITRLKKLYR